MKKEAQLICEDDIVMSMANSRELVGKVAIIKVDFQSEATFGGFLGVIRTYKILPYFVLNLLRSDYARRTLISSASQTTNIANISIGKLNPFLVPLPPLSEQRRIVAKIDELMARCDELEKLRAQRDQQRITVHAAAISRLLATSSSPAAPAHQKDNAFGEAWQFITHHFGDLYTVKENVAELRKAILQLAVMGKLVPQDPNDPPASELLEHLREARSCLYRKDTYKDNPETKTMIRKLSKLDGAMLPFLLPSSWTAVHLIDCCEFLVDCHNKTATYTKSGIPIIRTTNIRERQIRTFGMKYIDKVTYEFWARRCPPKPGDIIFTREAPMGEAAIIPEGMICCLGQRTMLIRPMQEFINNKYLLFALTEPRLLERASSSAIGSTVKHLRVGDVEELNIPLPPLPEQHRIVAKIDQLMALCDRLEANIATATHQQTKLLYALMAEV